MGDPPHLSAALEPEAAIVDERSFGEFLERERYGLYGAPCFVTRNRHEAEELTQDAFVPCSSDGIG